jgi:outer membrane protein assembly factor BamB
VATADTTISCRAFALTTALLVGLGPRAIAAEKPPPPNLPVTTHWSVDLRAGVTAGPVSDGDSVYLAQRSAEVVALAGVDGHELWRVAKTISTPMAASSGLLFLAETDAVEALRGDTGVSAWIAPQIKATAPLISAGGFVITATESDVVAIRETDGQIAWRRPGGGVRLAPTVDANRVFVGADDGRIAAIEIASGAAVWEAYVPGGVTALAAQFGRVYAGAGDKQFYCLDARSGKSKWNYRIGSMPSGAIAVDEDRVYFAALDNVIRALDRGTGNLRWQTPLNRRPVSGVHLTGRVVFVQIGGTEMLMLLDRNGARSGAIGLPGETTRETPPEVRATAAGVNVFVVTGGLSNKWQLTLIGPATEAATVPFERMPLPGVPFLTDPALAPLARVVPWLVLGDPMLRPLSVMDWPILMIDPPLEPLTTLPGIQLRPLSPVLPVRRGA